MKSLKKLLPFTLLLAGLIISTPLAKAADEDTTTEPKLTLRTTSLLKIPMNLKLSGTYDSGINIAYPRDGVKGIYVQAFRAKDDSLKRIIDYVNATPINTIVTDVRDGYGEITMPLDSDNPKIAAHTNVNLPNPTTFLKELEKNNIYPIARIVSFGDSHLPKERPDLSFRNSLGDVWQTSDGETFLNPFLKENWEYIADIAVGAAKLGFKDIQLDYVRFPISFELAEPYLTYDRGDYNGYTDMDEARFAAISDFVAFVREKLKPYNVHLSADILANAVSAQKIGGIGQRFVDIAEHVDVISPMIFPSHWVPGTFDVANPDGQPYDIISRYLKIEQGYIHQLNPAPTSRPWIQAFTADFLGEGNYQLYTADVISQEINALKEAGINEYLLWNAASQYSRNINF